jgi:hypothetical protein
MLTLLFLLSQNPGRGLAVACLNLIVALALLALFFTADGPMPLPRQTEHPFCFNPALEWSSKLGGDFVDELFWAV